MRERTRFSPPVVGGSSLLVIFSVLCLTILALLGLSTVQAEQRMADASVQAVSAYYKADCQAELIFARLRNGEVVEGVKKNKDKYMYECLISENQKLMVELQCEEGGWKILRWQAVAEAEMAEEADSFLWDGET